MKYKIDSVMFLFFLLRLVLVKNTAPFRRTNLDTKLGNTCKWFFIASTASCV